MTSCDPSKLMQNTSRKVNRLYERFFYWWGCTVASNPYKVILATLLLTGLCSLGLLKFRSEADGWKIWLPEGSRHSQVLRYMCELLCFIA